MALRSYSAETVARYEWGTTICVSGGAHVYLGVFTTRSVKLKSRGLCLEGLRGTLVKNTRLVFKLRGTGSLAEAGSEKAGADGFALADWGFAGVGGIESIEDEEIAFGVVECGECGDTLKVVHR